MAAKRVFTESEVEDLLAKVLGRKQKADKPSAEVENALRKQDAAILRGELAREKRERVRRVARNPEASASDKVAALGGESALTPFQLLKLHDNETPTRPAMAALEPPPADLLRLVLGNRPSSKELARYTDLAEILGGNVTIGPNMSMEVHGEQVPGDLVKIMRYLIKGTRGHAQGPPEGTEQIATLLREGGIKRSRFPPGVQLLLGGRRRAQSEASVAETPRRRLPNVVDALTGGMSRAQLSSPELSSEDEEQEGFGLDCLSKAMDLAEKGDHDGAWDSLHFARQARAPRPHLKKAEAYCSQLRDAGER